MGKLSTAERKAYYRRGLDDHRELMRSAIAGIGRGEIVLALNLATSIRVLVHNGPGSVPLLKQLRGDYLALTIRVQRPPEPVSFSPLARKVTIMQFPFGVRFGTDVPLSLDPSPDMTGYHFISLGEWWTKPVLKVPCCPALCRKEVVLGVANKEAAHVDDEMNEHYRMVLKSEPVKFVNGNTELGPLNVTRFTLGAAGIELLDLLDRYFPVSVEEPPATLGASHTSFVR
jgi:hypothetical protein